MTGLAVKPVSSALEVVVGAGSSLDDDVEGPAAVRVNMNQCQLFKKT